MSDTEPSVLRYWRKRRGLTLAKVGEAVNTNAQQIDRLEKGQRKLTKEWAERLAAVLEVDALELLFPISSTAPIVGVVIAGKIQRGTDLGRAPMIPGTDKTIAAIRVSDSSLHRLAENGWLIYFSDRSEVMTESLLGALCVVETAAGDQFVATPFRGSRWDLHHLTFPGAPTLPDIKIAWAAEILALIPGRAADRLMAKMPENLKTMNG